MNYLELNAGLRCQFIHNASDNPQWVNCSVKAISDEGVALGVDVIDQGHQTLWYDRYDAEVHLVFRPVVDFTIHWQHHTGKRYEMICVANEHTTKEGFERVVVYRDPESGEVFARPVEEYIQKFSPVFDSAPVAPESDEILDSQHAPVVVSEGVQ